MRYWTEEEDRILRTCAQRGESDRLIAHKLGRTVASINRRITSKGLRKGRATIDMEESKYFDVHARKNWLV
jgi:hypothetical protein